jgi:hypothetical protein
MLISRFIQYGTVNSEIIINGLSGRITQGAVGGIWCNTPECFLQEVRTARKVHVILSIHILTGEVRNINQEYLDIQAYGHTMHFLLYTCTIKKIGKRKRNNYIQCFNSVILFRCSKTKQSLSGIPFPCQKILSCIALMDWRMFSEFRFKKNPGYLSRYSDGIRAG